jgi:hypothetical protein
MGELALVQEAGVRGGAKKPNRDRQDSDQYSQHDGPALA